MLANAGFRAARWLGGALLCVTGAASCAQSQTLPQAKPIVLPADPPTIKTTVVSTPVRAERAWSTARAPNARGGWIFMTQLMRVGPGKPARYVVADLQTGKYTVSDQARAQNGRTFVENGGFVTCYDPKDENVHDPGRGADPKTNTFIYRSNQPALIPQQLSRFGIYYSKITYDRACEAAWRF